MSSAAWQTAPIHPSPQVAPPVSKGNGPATTSQPAKSPAASSSEHTASNSAQQKDATGAEAPHRVNQRGAKVQDSQSTDNQTAGAQAAAPSTQEIPVAFRAVLNEVLPQMTEAQALAAQFAGRTADAPASATQAQEANMKSVLDAVPGPRTPQMRTAIDPGFQITRQTAGQTVSGADLGQKLAGSSLAFAARVAERASVQATVALRDPQSVISASRFDAAKTTTADTVLQTGSANKGQGTAPQVKAQPGQAVQEIAGSQPSHDSGANHEGSGQRDAGAANAADEVRADAAPQGAEPAQPVTGIGTAAPSLAAAAGSHGPATAKAAEPGTPQIMEPQGETSNPPGQSVRNISLRLTNAEQGAVQVRLSERAGELHISVRTPDTGLTRGLRDGLPDLMGRLQVNGYKAETWQPGGNGSHAGQNHGQEAWSQGNSRQQPGGGGQQQNQQDRQPRDEQAPQWVHELESSIQRSESPWSTSSTTR